MEIILKWDLYTSLEHIPMKFEIVIAAVEGDVEEDAGVDRRTTNLHNNKQGLISDISNLPSL